MKTLIKLQDHIYFLDIELNNFSSFNVTKLAYVSDFQLRTSTLHVHALGEQGLNSAFGYYRKTFPSSVIREIVEFANFVCKQMSCEG